MKTEPLSFDLIKTDSGTQSRVSINQDTVEDYSEIIAAAKPGEWPFPPLDVFFDGTDHFMADGFHRLYGALEAGRASAPCVIHPGTAQDALIFGMTANDRNGLRRTRADKRANVEWFLNNGGKITQKEIAQKSGVSERLVRTIVAERKPQIVPQQPPPVTEKRQIAGLQPEVGELPDFDEKPESTKPDKPSKPPKQYDRSAWYKQWNTSIGPLVRLVDRIANSVGEAHGARHKSVKAALETATQNMMEWMGVKR